MTSGAILRLLAAERGATRMCRFVTYLGKQPILLNELIEKPEHSLLNQSRKAREGKLGLNADGFGVGWYDHALDATPGLFKSMQPAWNDQNLKHLSAKIKSTCFVGHVRASTVGELSLSNCHPFSYQEFLFAHNGTIREFHLIKRQIANLLEAEFYDHIHGQTDSEYFFALLMHQIHQTPGPYTLDFLADCTLRTIQIINHLQAALKKNAFSRLNTVLTNGYEVLVTRYISHPSEQALSLYYSRQASGAVIIASEPLTKEDQWIEVPLNTLLLIDRELQITTRAIAFCAAHDPQGVQTDI